MPEQSIAIRPSVLLATGLLALHFAAAGLLWATPLPALGQSVFALAIVISLIYYLARVALLHASHSIVTLEIREGAVSLQTRRGEWLNGELLGSTYVSELLTILNVRLKDSYSRRHVILVPDNVNPEDFRRLRTWLRWHGGKDAGSGRIFS